MKHNLYIGVLIAPYRVDLCNWLYERFDCEIYHLFREDPAQGFDLSRAEAGCRFERRYLETGAIGSRRYGKGLRRLICAHKPEVVFVPEFSPVTLQVLWIRKTCRLEYKVVAFCDDSMDMIGGNDFSRLHRLLRRYVPRHLDNLILVNQDVTAWYQANFGKGVTLPILADEVRVRARMTEALPLCSQMVRQYALGEKKIILYVGRLVEIKNVGMLLEAAAGLDAKVVIVGDGEMRAQWEALAVKLGVDALFTGRKGGDELLCWYHLADVFVLPSRKEPYGAVVNEALIAGCPVVVSRLAGAASLVDGRNGVVFDPASPAELAAALQSILDCHSERVPCHSERSEGILRDNLMPMTFEEAVSTAIRRI